ncbi:MAG: aminotransferase class I/II-fold pyridoxal phosphate-dependent enzyme, partial [Candidatus Firestonebacteria bacterium]
MIDSNRIKRLPPYSLGKIKAIMAEQRAKGADIIDFGMGNPDKPTPTHIVDKLCEVARDPKAHRYSISKGMLNLRKAMAQRYKEDFNVDLDPESEIITTIGAKEGISHLALALIDEGDVVLVPNPTYPIHLYSVVIAGGNLVSIPLTKENGFVVDLNKIKKENLWPKPKMMILSYPHNPTTATVDLKYFEDVVAFAKENNIMIVHDLAYKDHMFDGVKAPSFLQVKGAKDVGVELFSLSKSYNMPGWRVAFAMGNQKMISDLAKIKSYMDYGIFTPIQVAAITALKGPQECVKEIADLYSKRRDVMIEGLEKAGWKIPKPKATMFIWAEIPDKFKSMGSQAFAAKLLMEGNVVVSAGVGFGEYGEGYVRFALIENEDRIRQ